MMKYAIILGICLILMLTGCGEKVERTYYEIPKSEIIETIPQPTTMPQPNETITENDTQDEVGGNTSGNIKNMAFIVQQGDWIYFTNKGIYRAKLDGTDRTKIADDTASFINVIDDWLYFCNTSDNGNLYKMRIDGGEKTKIIDGPALWVKVHGDWIYYMQTKQDSQNVDEYSHLYKIRTDGTNETQIIKADITASFSFEDNWIYYKQGSVLYKMEQDKMEPIEIYYGTISSWDVVDGWIYFIGYSDKRNICRMKTDGTGREKISDDTSMLLNVLNDWIYYVRADDEIGLYKMRTDGTQRIKLSDDISPINVAGNWVYYISDKYEFCRVGIDDNIVQQMNEDHFETIDFRG